MGTTYHCQVVKAQGLTILLGFLTQVGLVAGVLVDLEKLHVTLQNQILLRLQKPNSWLWQWDQLGAQI